ncbi:MAG TPA: hypothetical protein VHX49_08130, partial [Candidatus Acidoferrales bacterium]|nr:hypothetical protein [Candidatus Acidoferrales bacterium]
SLCGNLDFHSLYFLENRANRVAPTKLEIEKGCGNRFLALTTQTLKPLFPRPLRRAKALPFHSTATALQRLVSTSREQIFASSDM